LTGLGLQISEVLEALSADASSQVHVLLHHGHSVRVDSTEVGIFKESGEITLSSLLKSEQSLRLEAELTIDSVANGSHEPLEGCLGQQQICGLLVALDLSESDCTGSPAHLLLHAALGRCGLFDGLVLGGGCARLACLASCGDALLA